MRAETVEAYNAQEIYRPSISFHRQYYCIHMQINVDNADDFLLNAALYADNFVVTLDTHSMQYRYFDNFENIPAFCTLYRVFVHCTLFAENVS